MFSLCFNEGKKASPEAVDAALIAMRDWRGIDNLKNINNRTLIIWGDQDKAYNYKQVETLKKNIAKSELIIFKDHAHNVHLESPNSFNECVKNFLSDE